MSSLSAAHYSTPFMASPPSPPQPMDDNDVVTMDASVCLDSSSSSSTPTGHDRLALAQSLLAAAQSQSSAPQLLEQICCLLMCWIADDSSNGDDMYLRQQFQVLLIQAKHRLAQLWLKKDNLEHALSLFLQVLHQHSDSLSPFALALSWYDVSLIYIKQGKQDHALASLKYSIQLLQAEERNGMHIDPALTYFVTQAAQACCNQGRLPPWSHVFSVVSYHNGEVSAVSGTVGHNKRLAEEAQFLMDPSIQAAGAA